MRFCAPGRFLKASFIAISPARLPCRAKPIWFSEAGETSRSLDTSRVWAAEPKLGRIWVMSRSWAIAASTTRGSLAPRLLDQAWAVQSMYSLPWSSQTSEPRALTRLILSAGWATAVGARFVGDWITSFICLSLLFGAVFVVLQCLVLDARLHRAGSILAPGGGALERPISGRLIGTAYKSCHDRVSCRGLSGEGKNADQRGRYPPVAGVCHGG